MARGRYLLSFFLTLLLYSLLIGGYLYWQKRYSIVGTRPKTKTITLSLQTFTPPPPSVETMKIPEFFEKPKLKTVQPVDPLPQTPRFSPTPKPQIHTKRKKQRRHTKKTVRKQKQHRHTPTRQPLHENPSVVKTTQTIPAPVKTIPKPQTDNAQRNRFLAMIRTRIDRAKHYPRIAKKRGIQGNVRVTFTIRQNGTVTDIQIEGPRVFHTSAKEAVQAAFPVDTTNVPVSFPLEVRLNLHYRIR